MTMGEADALTLKAPERLEPNLKLVYSGSMHSTTACTGTTGNVIKQSYPAVASRNKLFLFCYFT